MPTNPGRKRTKVGLEAARDQEVGRAVEVAQTLAAAVAVGAAAAGAQVGKRKKIRRAR